MEDTSQKQEQQELNELKSCKERLLYLTAEFDTYKRRAEKQQLQCFDDGQSQVIKEILPIVDNFERAFTEFAHTSIPQELQAHITGIELILKELHKILKNYRVEEIPTHGLFNPELHEALSQVTSTEHPTGHIVTVYQKGYMRKGQLLRPAQVAVAR